MSRELLIHNVDGMCQMHLKNQENVQTRRQIPERIYQSTHRAAEDEQLEAGEAWQNTVDCA